MNNHHDCAHLLRQISTRRRRSALPITDSELSPAVNDPGTAIDIIGILVRLFTMWVAPADTEEPREVTYDRVEVPELSSRDMFDDAFTAIARDGSGSVEVMIRLQKALASLASVGDPLMASAARHHARRALEAAELALPLTEDVALVREHAGIAAEEPRPESHPATRS